MNLSVALRSRSWLPVGQSIPSSAAWKKQVWPSQTSAQIVRVDGWTELVDAEVFPVGSKPKTQLICPEETTLPFLIPGHRYMFKKPPDWKIQQIWSEVIAYELSKLCGVDAPPCFAALDASTGQPGVLMEFFYGYPDEAQAVRLVAGTDRLQLMDKTYDSQTGRPHEVQRNIAVCRAFRVPSPLEWWAKTLTFDALIGNTDRHAENWGLLRGGANDPTAKWKMAPPFDNGTSLGYEILEDQLEQRSTPTAIAQYIAKGRHHCTWTSTDEKHGEGLTALCKKFCVAYPQIKEVVERVIPTKDAAIDEIVSRWVAFDFPVKFSAARAIFVERLIRARRDALAAELGL